MEKLNSLRTEANLAINNMSLPGAWGQQPSALGLLGDTGQGPAFSVLQQPQLPQPTPAVNPRVRNQRMDQPGPHRNPKRGGKARCPQVTTGSEGLRHTRAFLLLTHRSRKLGGGTPLPSTHRPHQGQRPHLSRAQSGRTQSPWPWTNILPRISGKEVPRGVTSSITLPPSPFSLPLFKETHPSSSNKHTGMHLIL